MVADVNSLHNIKTNIIARKNDEREQRKKESKGRGFTSYICLGVMIEQKDLII